MLKKFHNMKIARRITFICIAILITASISGFAGLIISNTIDKDYSDALVFYGFSQGNIGSLGINVQKEKSLLLEIVTSPDANDRTAHIQEINELDSVIDSDLALIKNHLVSQNEHDVFNLISTSLETFHTDRDAILDIAQGATVDNDILLQIYDSKCKLSVNELADNINSLLTEKSTIGINISDGLTLQTLIFTFVILGIILIGTIIALFFAKQTSGDLKKPIEELENAAKLMATGDLSIHVSYESENELGSLSKSMNTTIGGLSEIVSDLRQVLGSVADGDFTIHPAVPYPKDFEAIDLSLRGFINQMSATLVQINDSSTQVAESASQIAEGAQALTEGATDQASSIEELQATVTSVSSEVEHNAKNSEAANQKAKAVGVEVEESNSQMQEMVTAMNLISETSTEISNIINTINDIASQTNLLSLNASIEAARAGEMGKGFAVVANEVGNLATQSAQAAHSSTELIANSLKAVENGKQLADLAAIKLESSKEKTKELVSDINEISSASNRQAEALEQIAQAVEQIASVVEENTAMAEESSSSSEEMASQAALLKNLISHFKLLSS